MSLTSKDFKLYGSFPDHNEQFQRTSSAYVFETNTDDLPCKDDFLENQMIKHCFTWNCWLFPNVNIAHSLMKSLTLCLSWNNIKMKNKEAMSKSIGCFRIN